MEQCVMSKINISAILKIFFYYLFLPNPLFLSYLHSIIYKYFLKTFLDAIIESLSAKLVSSPCSQFNTFSWIYYKY